MRGFVSWICHGATASNRSGRFPVDEPLEEASAARLRALAGSLGRVDRVYTSPALRARQTAEAFGLEGRQEPLLRECDYGRWSGLGLAEIARGEPAGLAEWMSDIGAAPHGGEPLLALCERVAEWMAGSVGDGGRSVVVTHASVVRAAVLAVLRAPAAAFWAIDVEPLSRIDMTTDGRRWQLRLPPLS